MSGPKGQHPQHDAHSIVAEPRDGVSRRFTRKIDCGAEEEERPAADATGARPARSDDPRSGVPHSDASRSDSARSDARPRARRRDAPPSV